MTSLRAVGQQLTAAGSAAPLQLRSGSTYRVNGNQLTLFPTWRPTSGVTIDGTCSDTKEKEIARLNRGPIWQNNSCPVDSLFFAASQLQVGRTKADQVFFDEFCNSSTFKRFYPSIAFMRVMQRDWTEDPETCRDIIRNIAYDHSPHNFKIGSFYDPVDLAQVLLVLVPQLSFHCAEVFFKKDMVKDVANWTWKKGSDGQVRSHPRCIIQLTSTSGALESMSDPVEDWFAPEDVSPDDKKYKMYVVTDRLPLTLMVSLGGLPPPSSPFSTFKFRYYLEREERQAVYRPIGFIKYITSKQHFTVFWTHGSKIISYDGMRHLGEAQVMRGNGEDIKYLAQVPMGKEDKYCAIFYRQVSDAPINIDHH